MIKLNLEAKNRPQQLILAYLEENVSEVLADKINNGTPLEKDNKQLINKKTLDGFMKYANDEARKQAEKGANSACVEDEVVYGWAIHYFEEDSIEGTLYNLDGTEYKPVTKTATKKANALVTATKAKPKEDNKIKQTSFFDLFADEEKQDNNAENQPKIDTKQDIDADNVSKIDDNIEVEEPEDLDAWLEENEGKIEEEQEEPKHPLSPYYAIYNETCERYPNNVVIQKYGDFYEIFDEYAVELSEKIDLTLTSRDFGGVTRTPMIGFPYHAADIYLNKIRQYYNVVIIDDNGTKQLPQIAIVGNNMIDMETGEILNKTFSIDKYFPTPLDNELLQYLNGLLDDTIKFI